MNSRSLKEAHPQGASLEHVFPATRGIQGETQFFLSVCPAHVATKLFSFRDSDLPESMHLYRGIDQSDVERISQYLLSNPTAYAIPPICITIDTDFLFEPITPDSELGRLHIPMSATLVVSSGENTLAAIQKASVKLPGLLSGQIAVSFYPVKNLKHAADMYLGFKAFASRQSSSLRRLESKEDIIRLSNQLVSTAAVFKGFVDMKRSSLAPRSKMLFTLSSIIQATRTLLNNLPATNFEERQIIAAEFWSTVGSEFPEWDLVREGKMLSSELRVRFIHSHGAVLLALGKAGNALLLSNCAKWKEKLRALKDIDWRRSNAKVWEGRALVAGKVSKALPNVLLTANVIKTALGLPVDDEASAEHLQTTKRRKQ